MPEFARCRRIIAHCDYCYVNGATGYLGTSLNERLIAYRNIAPHW